MNKIKTEQLKDKIKLKCGYKKYVPFDFMTSNLVEIVIEEAKKEVLDDLDKLFTKHIRKEKKKPQTDYGLAIIRALSFARREVRKRHLKQKPPPKRLR